MSKYEAHISIREASIADVRVSSSGRPIPMISYSVQNISRKVEQIKFMALHCVSISSAPEGLRGESTGTSCRMCNPGPRHVTLRNGLFSCAACAVLAEVGPPASCCSFSSSASSTFSTVRSTRSSWLTSNPMPIRSWYLLLQPYSWNRTSWGCTWAGIR